MSVQPNTEFVANTASRPVWVLNRNSEPYIEKFRGEEITVPGNNQKIYKSIREGGSIMGFLEARKFLGQPKAVANKNVKGVIIVPEKALQTVEMTENELSKWLDKDVSQVKKEAEDLMIQDKNINEKKEIEFDDPGVKAFKD